MFNELIDAVNNGTGGGVASQNLDFYAASIEAFNRHVINFKQAMSSGEEPKPEEIMAKFDSHLNEHFEKINTLASKAYEKGLSVAGLGMFLRWAYHAFPTMSMFLELGYPLPSEYNKMFERFLSIYGHFF